MLWKKDDVDRRGDHLGGLKFSWTLNSKYYIDRAIVLVRVLLYEVKRLQPVLLKSKARPAVDKLCTLLDYKTGIPQ